MKVYLLGMLLFGSWIVALLSGATGGYVHVLPVLSLFVIAFGQSKRKKIVRYIRAIKAKLPFVAKPTVDEKHGERIKESV